MRGDHIKVPGSLAGVYEHHGIDLGDGNVVHFSSNIGTWVQQGIDSFFGGSSGDASAGPRIAEKPVVQVESMREFTKNGSLPVTVVQACASHDDADHIILRGMSAVGQDKYDLVFNNCEHFATWAFSGESGRSEQVESFAASLATAAAIATTAYVLSKSKSSAAPVALMAGAALAHASLSSSSASAAASDAHAKRSGAYLADTDRDSDSEEESQNQHASSKSYSSSSSSSSSITTAALVASAAAGLAYFGSQAYNYAFSSDDQGGSGGAASSSSAAAEPVRIREEQFTPVCVIEPGAAPASSAAAASVHYTAPSASRPSPLPVLEPGAGAPVSRFADAIAQLREMGFEDARQCEAALEATKGSLDDAIVLLMK